MIPIFRKLLALLTKREKRQLLYLVIPITLSGILDVVGIAFVMPFMAVVIQPHAIEKHKALSIAYHFLHFPSHKSFFIALGILVLIVLVAGNALTAITSWVVFKYAAACEHQLSTRMLKLYMMQPYNFFLKNNKSELLNTMIIEANEVCMNLLVQAIMFFSKVMGITFVTILLLAINPKVSIVIGLILGFFYLLVTTILKKKMEVISPMLLGTRQKKHKFASEALSGIKEIKLLGEEEFFIDRYVTPAQDCATCTAKSAAYGTLPKYILESIAFGAIIIFILILLYLNRNLAVVLPLVAVYIFAGYRLMPSLQALFTSVSLVRSAKASVEYVESQYTMLLKNQIVDKPKDKISFKNQVELKDISFAYNKETPIIENLNINIKHNTTIGFVGLTGAGKTTIVDLILGLLQPTSGKILVDEQPLTSKMRNAWGDLVGYVPQHIYLTDDTLANNIGYGLSPEEIDQDKIIHAAKIAQIHDFIEKELPDGYDTLVGDQGVRLSGGQRQRIGIARALYRDPELIVFDEATSALDGITERLIIDMIQQLAYSKTIIIIAHRFSSIKLCDNIYFLEHGKILSQGSYDYLFENNKIFKNMAIGAAGDKSHE